MRVDEKLSAFLELEPVIHGCNTWRIVAQNLKKAGWNCGSISSTDRNGRQFWVVAAERDDGGRFIVRANEKLTAFVELQRAIHAFAVSLIS